ncbi:MAG: hypothetical protein GY842_14230 [bacterium]|nr:hypothetical protein [bacterium]
MALMGAGSFGALATPPAKSLRPNAEVLNLDFEAGDTPAGWEIRGEGYTTDVTNGERNSGEQSLRLTYNDGNGYAIAYTYLSAEPARGKRLRFSGFLKTADITRGWAGLWIRADDAAGRLAYEGMGKRGVSGSTPWTQYEVAIDVPEDAEAIRFGAILRGNGTLWVDSLTLEVEEAAGPGNVSVRGAVRDPAGRPLAGAHVALIRPLANHATAHVKSRTDGSFAVAVPPGSYALTATAECCAAAFLKVTTFEVGEEPSEQVLTLGEDGIRVSGHVRDEDGRPLADVLVCAFHPGFPEGDLFYTTTDIAGRFGFGLVKGTYSLSINSDEYRARTLSLAGNAEEKVEIAAHLRSSAPDEVVTWIRHTAIPLTTAAPGADLADLAPLAEVVGNARAVGIGEATHGTREFFQLKHRMLELLVEKMGFTVFAIEAGWPESLAVNDYVLYGRGDAAKALRGLHVWPAKTEEMLELVEWMRRYNADPTHRRKIKFYGIDMQFTPAAVTGAHDYLRQVDSDVAKAFATLVEPLEELRAVKHFAELDDHGEARLIIGLEATIALFDVERESWIEKTGKLQWELGRHHVVILLEVIALYQNLDDGFALRDRMMSLNVGWIFDHEPPGTRVLISAHNGHLTREHTRDFRPLGWHLNQMLGADYVSLGFVFHQGAFQAIDATRVGPDRRLRQITLGPPPPDFLGAALARAGLPILALDLRSPAPDMVATWFRTPQSMRRIGIFMTGEKSMYKTMTPRVSFDALFFVETTSRARPLGRASQRTGPQDEGSSAAVP